MATATIEQLRDAEIARMVRVSGYTKKSAAYELRTRPRSSWVRIADQPDRPDHALAVAVLGEDPAEIERMVQVHLDGIAHGFQNIEAERERVLDTIAGDPMSATEEAAGGEDSPAHTFTPVPNVCPVHGTPHRDGPHGGVVCDRCRAEEEDEITGPLAHPDPDELDDPIVQHSEYCEVPIDLCPICSAARAEPAAPPVVAGPIGMPNLHVHHGANREPWAVVVGRTIHRFADRDEAKAFADAARAA